MDARCNYCEAHGRRKKRAAAAARPLFACERCGGLAVYCGAACQSADWGAHESVCDAVQRVRAMLAGAPMKRRRSNEENIDDDDDDYDYDEEDLGGGSVDGDDANKRARLEAASALGLEHMPAEIAVKILFHVIMGAEGGGHGAPGRASSRAMYEYFDLAYRDLATHEFGWSWPEPVATIEPESGELVQETFFDTEFQRAVVEYVNEPHELAESAVGDAQRQWFAGARNGWFLGYRFAVNRRLAELFTAGSQAQLVAYVERFNHQPYCVYVPMVQDPTAMGVFSYYVVPRAARNVTMQLVGPIGTMPAAIGELVHLRTLSAWNAGIREVPRGILGPLRRLVTLELDNNALSKLPRDIGGLRSLRELDVSGNELQRLPDAICELHELRTLVLSNNELEELPPCLDLEHMPHLLLLSITYNNIQSHSTFSPLASFGQQQGVLVTPPGGAPAYVTFELLAYSALSNEALAKYVLRRPLDGVGTVVNWRGIVARSNAAQPVAYELVLASDKLINVQKASITDEYRLAGSVYFSQETLPLPREAFPLYLHEVTFTDSLGRAHTLQPRLRCELDTHGGVLITSDDQDLIPEDDAEPAAARPDDARVYRKSVLWVNDGRDVVIGVETIVDVTAYGGLTCAAITAGMRHNRRFRNQPLPEIDCEP